MIFCSVVVGVLAETLQYTYLHYKTIKEMWDTLNTEYGGSDAGTELYITEQYHDYQMVDEKSVVTQAHKIQCMVKELRLLKIVVPNEFVAGGCRSGFTTLLPVLLQEQPAVVLMWGRDLAS
jgi:hypothetical protein